MEQITLNLDATQQRPVVALENLTALLDTGAVFPVWTDDEGVLVSDLNAEFVRKNVSFTGFGGTAVGNLYKVNLYIGKLVFPAMPIIACNELNTSYNLILSATMFRNLVYEIDDKNHKLNVVIPDDESHIRNLVVKNSDGRLYVLCSSDNKGVEDIATGFGDFNMRHH